MKMGVFDFSELHWDENPSGHEVMRSASDGTSKTRRVGRRRRAASPIIRSIKIKETLM